MLKAQNGVQAASFRVLSIFSLMVARTWVKPFQYINESEFAFVTPGSCPYKFTTRQNLHPRRRQSTTHPVKNEQVSAEGSVGDVMAHVAMLPSQMEPSAMKRDSFGPPLPDQSISPSPSFARETRRSGTRGGRCPTRNRREVSVTSHSISRVTTSRKYAK